MLKSTTKFSEKGSWILEFLEKKKFHILFILFGIAPYVILKVILYVPMLSPYYNCLISLKLPVNTTVVTENQNLTHIKVSLVTILIDPEGRG